MFCFEILENALTLKLLYMKKMIMIMAALVTVFATACSEKKVEIKVMSYNIRAGVANDGDNSWEFRKPATKMLIEDVKPDIFGVQEAVDFQLNYILEECPGYKCVGVGREDGKSKGEHMSIFWNTEKIELLDWGTYWLSETPDTVSKGWDAACIRTATWTYLQHKESGKKFYYVNTHLDHIGPVAQSEGLSLVVDRIAEMNPDGNPMILTGDFNIRPDNPALTENLDHKMKSARVYAKVTDNRPTFNNWKEEPKKEDVIDYIYFSSFSECLDFSVITKQFGDHPFVSDHYPVVSTLVF